MIIYVVIPAYNEDETIKQVVLDVMKYIKNIIVVNDCSTDNTSGIINKLGIDVIQNQKNIGYTKTIEKGIQYALNKKADYIITFDADGQHSVQDLQKMVLLIEKSEPDLILGVRSEYNRFMEHVWSFYSKMKYGFTDPLCGLKAYKKDLFLKYRTLENNYTIGTEILFKALKQGASFKEIPVHIKKRTSPSRFGNQLLGNWLELKGLITVITKS
jgi:glycosyltransferase involved in cell wall biosynthesis